jgi:hypothetical protein
VVSEVKAVAVAGKERKGFIILALMSIALSIGVLVFGSVQLANNNHKFCIIFYNITSSKSPPKPQDPKAHPSREQAYEQYQRFLTLGRELGCNVDR